MAVQVLPIIKMLAPYVTQVATAAIPAFTSKPAEVAKSDPVMAQQIQELQTAVTQNAQSIHLLAEKLQQAITSLEIAAEEGRRQVAAYKTLLFTALGLSVVSSATSVIMLLN